MSKATEHVLRAGISDAAALIEAAPAGAQVMTGVFWSQAHRLTAGGLASLLSQ
jgi:hypothetical protein